MAEESRERAGTSEIEETRSLRVPIALLSLAALGTAGYVIYREARADLPYRVHQRAYGELLGRREPVKRSTASVFAGTTASWTRGSVGAGAVSSVKLEGRKNRIA